MSKTHSVSISCEGYGLAGNLVLPDGASAQSPVPGAVIIGGPGPLPLVRYSETGARQWPVLWSESLGKSGLAALCYDQRGGGLSGGAYHEADWSDLLEENRAAIDTLALQPEVGPVAGVALPYSRDPLRPGHRRTGSPEGLVRPGGAAADQPVAE